MYHGPRIHQRDAAIEITTRPLIITRLKRVLLKSIPGSGETVNHYEAEAGIVQ